MVNFAYIMDLARLYNVPVEDVLFIALNLHGVKINGCCFNRMRMAIKIIDDDIFCYSKNLKVFNFYFALPVNQDSPFSIDNNRLFFDQKVIAETRDVSEDFCDSNYPRREGTVLNINPNSRTSCRGCQFCYTGYQIPRDRKKIACELDIRDFFEEWLAENKKDDLSSLIQIAVVTGCYNSNEELASFLLMLRKVLNSYNFSGEIFYLGSQITDNNVLKKLVDIQPFCYCFSLDCFEDREYFLRDRKSAVTIDSAFDLMNFAKSIGHRVNFSYVLGLESLSIVEKYFLLGIDYINSFPIINTLQIHKYHDKSLMNVEANNIEYFLEARKILENIFAKTNMEPREWENYRSLWFLKFREKNLTGIRMP